MFWVSWQICSLTATNLELSISRSQVFFKTFGKDFGISNSSINICNSCVRDPRLADLSPFAVWGWKWEHNSPWWAGWAKLGQAIKCSCWLPTGLISLASQFTSGGRCAEYMATWPVWVCLCVWIQAHMFISTCVQGEGGGGYRNFKYTFNFGAKVFFYWKAFWLFCSRQWRKCEVSSQVAPANKLYLMCQMIGKWFSEALCWEGFWEGIRLSQKDWLLVHPITPEWNMEVYIVTLGKVVPMFFKQMPSCKE